MHPRRGLARVAVHVAEPAHRLRDRREPGALRVRPGLAVARDARQDDARVDVAHPVVPDPPALERARAEVLRDDVGVLDQPEEQLLPARLPKIERDALLVAGLHRPPERAPLVPGFAPVPDRVGLARRLHLDHLGAEVAEEPPRERACEQRPELEDPQAGQRAALGHGHRRHALAAPSGCTRGTSSPPASMCWTSTPRASETCSRITDSASVPSPRASASTSWTW